MAPGFGDAWRRRKAPSWQQQPRSPSPSPERPPPSPAPCAPPGGGGPSPPHLLGGAGEGAAGPQQSQEEGESSGAARRPSHSPAPGASGCRPREGGGGGGRGAEPRGGPRGLRQPGCASRGLCPPGPAASIVVPRRERSPQGAGMEPSGGERSPLGGNGAPSPGHRPPGQPGRGGNASCWRPPEASRRGLAAGHAFGGKKGLFRLVQQRSPAAFPRARPRLARGERDGGGAAGPCGAAPGRCRPPGHWGLNPAQGLREMNSRMNQSRAELERGWHRWDSAARPQRQPPTALCQSTPGWPCPRVLAQIFGTCRKHAVRSSQTEWKNSRASRSTDLNRTKQICSKYYS